MRTSAMGDLGCQRFCRLTAEYVDTKDTRFLQVSDTVESARVLSDRKPPANAAPLNF